jgi:hypothetical protein
MIIRLTKLNSKPNVRRSEIMNSDSVILKISRHDLNKVTLYCFPNLDFSHSR